MFTNHTYHSPKANEHIVPRGVSYGESRPRLLKELGENAKAGAILAVRWGDGN